MKSFADKADESVPCVRIEDADATAYRIRTYDGEVGLVPAKELGTDSYPQFGDWLPCTAINRDKKPLGDRYLEAPGSLAAELERHQAGEGFEFRMTTIDKIDGVWQIEIEALP